MDTYCRSLLFGLSAILIVGCGEPPNVKVTRESDEALFPATFDSDFLRRLESSTASAARARLAETYERNEVPPSARTSEPRLQSHYLQTETGRLAVIEIGYTGTPVRVTRVTGLVNGELVTVSCTSPTGRSYNLSDRNDECGRQVQKTFFR